MADIVFKKKKKKIMLNHMKEVQKFRSQTAGVNQMLKF